MFKNLNPKPRKFPHIVQPLEARRLLAAVPQLVVDFNTLPHGSSPAQFVEFNGALYFYATDNEHGRELWRTDGTLQGTTIVHDVNPGVSAGGMPVVFNGALYFDGTTTQTGNELWRSDGTPGGVELVTDVNPGAASSSPRNLTIVGDTLFFTANDAAGGNELWKTDGTPEGTMRVKDICPGTSGSFPTGLTVVADTLFFTADDGVRTYLWRSDGTEAGTVPVSGIADSPTALTAFNGAIYYTEGAHDGTIRPEPLYRSDATTGDTAPVGSFRLSRSAYSDALVASGEWLYFALNGELWKSDGTAAGTSAVKLVVPQGNPDSLFEITPIGDGKVFFYADHPDTGLEPWVSDGTAQGTVMLADVVPGSGDGLGTQANALHVGDGLVYFVGANPAADHSDTWVTDGTADGTRKLSDASLSTNSSSPIATFGGHTYFAASPPTGGLPELWRTDGTPEGTALFADLRDGTADSQLWSLIPLPGGRALFHKADPVRGAELWVTDGTAAGTSRINDIHPGPASLVGGMGFPQRIGNRVFFVGNDADHGFELWSTDGTREGTAMVVDLAPGRASGVNIQSTIVVNGFGMTTVGGNLYFSGSTTGAPGSYALWRTDGTPAGTVHVSTNTPWPLSQEGQASNHYAFGDILLFTRGLLLNAELWKTDGTTAGTMLVKDIYAGSGSSNPGRFHEHDGLVYFVATTAAQGQELWVTDGTTNGTRLVKDVNPGAASSSIGGFATVDGVLYFTANDGVHGQEFWRTDGTPAGTRMVADLRPGPVSSVPDGFFDIGERLLFFGDDGQHGRELWRFDGELPSGGGGGGGGGGADAGLVRELVEGPGSPLVSNSINTRAWNGLLWFSANDGINGTELYRSDGTPDGTVMVSDVPGADGLAPFLFDFRPSDTKLYFPGFERATGRELYALADDTPPRIISSGFNPATRMLHVRFSEDIADPLDPAALVVTRIGGGSVAPATFTFDRASATARLTFAPGMADGNYRVTLPAGAVADVSGNALADAFTQDFFVFAGDVNRDRAVNFDDLAILAQHYNAAGKTFDQGDFNYDGLVNFDDLAIMAQRYNTSLPPPVQESSRPPASAPALLQSPPAPLKKPLPKKSFGTRRIA